MGFGGTNVPNIAGNLDFSSREDSRNATREGRSYSNAAASFMQNSNYSSLGINGAGARDAADKITRDITNLQEYITSLSVDQSTINEAFQGSDLEASLEAYLSETRKYLSAVVSDLKQLTDKLYTVADAYEQWQKEKAQQVETNAADSYSSVTGEYETTSVPSNASIPGGK